ncbi:MAG: hypothetical protein HY842_06790 [Bacteroidetes bacterium]|nr:hypothetical protein [Bacteroidota bacterium]
MERYLRHLYADLESCIEQAPQVPEFGWVPFFRDEEEESYDSTRTVQLSMLLGIPADAFPPERLLTSEQVDDLLDAIFRLWKSWQLWWDMPLRLTRRQQYSALLHALQNEQVAWHCEHGAEVKICHYETGTYCPFGQDGGYCYCKEIDESAKHDIAIWEEHVRSQGLDPYRELTPEEEAAFEEEMRIRDLRKRYGDDWEKYAFTDYSNGFDEMEEEEEDFQEEEQEDDDWLDSFIWEAGRGGHSSDDVERDASGGRSTDEGQDEPVDEDGFDLPFF